jgi:thiol-disulfide isomerase/thioredoxin
LLATAFLGTASLASANPQNPFALQGELFMEPADYIERPTSKQNYREKLEALVAQASGEQARLIDFFAGPGGLTGVVIQGLQSDSKRIIGWVTPGTNHLVVGKVFDRDGTDATEIAHDAFISGIPSTSLQMPKEDALSMARSFQGLVQFEIKNPVNTLFVFASPDCSYCRRLHRNISNLEKEFKRARVEVKWLMVGFSDEAVVKAANILDKGFSVWGNRIEAQPSADHIEAVENNARLLSHTLTNIVTPTLIWEADGITDMISYAPDRLEIKEILEKISRK